MTSKERVLLTFANQEPDRFLNIQLEITRRTLEAAQGGVDFIWIDEDMGTQNSPLISMDLFQRHIHI